MQRSTENPRFGMILFAISMCVNTFLNYVLIFGKFGAPHMGVTGAAALKKACEEGLIPHDATVVSVVTGNGLKDVANAIKSAGEPLHIEPDLDLMVRGFAERGVTVE